MLTKASTRNKKKSTKNWTNEGSDFKKIEKSDFMNMSDIRFEVQKTQIENLKNHKSTMFYDAEQVQRDKEVMQHGKKWQYPKHYNFVRESNSIYGMDQLQKQNLASWNMLREKTQGYYFVASFNHWFPVEMEFNNKKNKFLFTDILPQGKHFFYFVKDGTQFCLSHSYPQENYPGTNVKMNVIELHFD